VNDYNQQVNDLINQAEVLGEGPAKTALIEEAVRIVDSHNDVDQGFALRRRLMEASMMSGQMDKLIVSFSWNLAQSDRDPKRFPEQKLLWEFRWVVNELTSFPNVPRSQIEEMLAEMRRRYERAGSTMRAYHLLRRVLATELGDAVMAEDAHREFEKSRRDSLSDSPVTELSFLVSYKLFLKDYEGAVRLAAPILRGAFRCEHFEGTNRSRMLVPLVRLGRYEEAMRYQSRGYHFVSRNPRFIARIGDHILFMILTDNLSRSLDYFVKHFKVALTTVDVSCRFGFYLACRYLFRHLDEEGIETHKMRLPEAFPMYQPDGEYRIAELRKWFEGETTDLAAQFDSRNGNAHYAGRIAAQTEYDDLIKPWPLPRHDKEERH
jgi:hypothetical protein